MHNLAYALKWHLSTDAEVPSDLRARLRPPVGKPFGAVLSVLPGTVTSPKSTQLQVRTHLSVLLFCNLLAATVPVISDWSSVGEDFQSSEWALKARAVALPVALGPTCAVEAKLETKAIGHKNPKCCQPAHFCIDALTAWTIFPMLVYLQLQNEKYRWKYEKGRGKPGMGRFSTMPSNQVWAIGATKTRSWPSTLSVHMPFVAVYLETLMLNTTKMRWTMELVRLDFQGLLKHSLKAMFWKMSLKHILSLALPRNAM